MRRIFLADTIKRRTSAYSPNHRQVRFLQQIYATKKILKAKATNDTLTWRLIPVCKVTKSVQPHTAQSTNREFPTTNRHPSRRTARFFYEMRTTELTNGTLRKLAHSTFKSSALCTYTPNCAVKMPSLASRFTLLMLMA